MMTGDTELDYFLLGTVLGSTLMGLLMMILEWVTR